MISSICVAIAMLVQLGLTVRARLKMKANFQAVAALWNDELVSTEGVYKRLLAEQPAIAHRASVFDGRTRTSYEHSLNVWAAWLAQRARQVETLQQAKELHQQYCRQRWWNLSTKALVTASAKLSAGELSVASTALTGAPCEQLAVFVHEAVVNVGKLPSEMRKMRNGAPAVAAELDLFANALKNATLDEAAVKLKLSAGPGTQGDGIDTLKERVQTLRLPLTPYMERLDNVNRLRDEFLHAIASDPLSNHDDWRCTLFDKIDLVTAELKQAIDLHPTFEQCRDRALRLQERVAQLHQMQVTSSLADVVFDCRYALVEHGFEVDGPLSQCMQLIATMEETYRDGHLIDFVRIRNEAQAGLGIVEHRVQQALEDKEHVDSIIAKVDSESTEADLKADRPQRRSISKAYKSQRWNAARKAVDAFTVRHALRVSVRAEVSGLSAALMDLRKEVEANEKVLSAQFDKALVASTRQIASLLKKAALGKTDWDKLREASRQLADELTGSGPEALTNRLKAEVAAHQEALLAVQSARECLADLHLKLENKWGGQAAAELLSQAEPALDQVLGCASTAKQDWLLLKKQADDALAGLQPARRLIYEQVSRHESLGRLLDTGKTQVESCDGETYTRTICGITYGAGLYCATTNIKERLQACRQRLERRDYNGLQSEVESLQDALRREHLECWWLSLQMMAQGGDPCASRFARMQGYSDGMFEAWIQQRAQPGQDVLYSPPQGPHKHDNGTLNRVWIGDTPSISDYEVHVG